MRKVVIVDDELLVRIGLKSTINWKEHGFNLVGEAKNSQEALEICRKLEPDIILTDIEMPGVNGLELIAALKEEIPPFIPIILTHHEDFHFAKQAISLGVIDYILKTNLTPARLLEVLEKARSQQTSKAVRQVKRDDEVKSSISPSIQKAFTDFCQREIDCEGKLSPYKLVVSTVQLQKIINQKQIPQDRIFEMFIQLSEQNVSQSPAPVFYEKKGSRILYIFLFDSMAELESMYSSVENLMRKILSTAVKFMGDFITSGVSKQRSEEMGFRELLREALEAEDRAFFSSPPIHLYSPRHDSVYIDDKIRFDPEDLLIKLETGRKEALIKDLDLMFEKAKWIGQYSLVKKMFTQLIDLFADYTTTINNSENLSNRIRNAYKAIDELGDFPSIAWYLTDLCSTIMDTQNSHRELEISHIIQQSQKYIDSHFRDNISLSNIAAQVEISKNYLSFLFKEELGINFTHYLTQVRIEKAKDLLSKTNKKIYEIADEVGFDSPYYFSKVFRERTGITCKDFRRNNFETIEDNPTL